MKYSCRVFCALSLGMAAAGASGCSSDDGAGGSEMGQWESSLLRDGAGSPGIGDPYYPELGNGGYDVSHYSIRLTYEPVSDRLSGSTTILAKATQDLTSFHLDFLLAVKSVRVNNATARFTSSGDELIIELPGKIGKGSNMNVVVQYDDIPSQATSKTAWIHAWRRTAGGAASVGEPFSAEWWYPCNNHPADKATYDVSVAVPEGYEVLSNGVLAGKTQQTDGWVRWYWRSTKPQITYASFIAMGQYDIQTSTTASGLPIINAFADDLGEYAELGRRVVNRTGEVIDFFESKLGPYPFEAAGGVVARGAFGLETQTRPMYGTAGFDSGYHDYFVVHELAHQWFGDSVSLQRWRDLWLNEGFAIYAEYIWSENHGEGTAQELAVREYNSHPAKDPFWEVLPGDPGGGRGKNFHLAVYYRGAIGIQALRNAVGDDTFFRIVRTWLQQKQYGHGTAEEFIALSERISGKSLRALFDTWFYTAGRPAFEAAASDVVPPAFEKIHGALDRLEATGHGSRHEFVR
ncbi:M1 family metallopeptidase [Pendulispora albinea]|uniref:Aminopeptidase N n=1 Tax=Pendulispora albinea TaxID=2741071 RepID=A0ABZ2M758_9BACT